jgi:hypothetical protein
MSRVYYDRLVAELARAEGMAYGDVGRLLADLDQRAKVEGRAMTETEKRHDRIPRVWLLARSPRVIADHFGISIADVNAAVDGKIVKLDNGYRVDLSAGHLCLNERSAAMFGIDAPLRIDAVQLVQDTGPQPTSTERIRVVLDQLMGRPIAPSTAK